MGVCSICLDDGEEIGYECAGKTCRYQLCIPCIRLSFEDASGANSNNCPMCATPMARNILKAVCGEGAIRAVENELRSKVEFDVRKEYLRKETGKKEIRTMKERAGKLFNELSGRLNMRCPRCNIVFFDYDGCNALTCDCGARFCAVCLQDCGTDAHPHVRQYHGDLYDKGAFEGARKKREAAVTEGFLLGIRDEPFEVQQLVKQMLDKSGSKDSKKQGRRTATGFLRTAKGRLASAVMKDRLAVLRDAEDIEYQRRGLGVDDISPRCVIPEDYELSLVRTDILKVYRIRLRWAHPIDGWKTIPLPSNEKEMDLGRDGDAFVDRPKVDSLSNIEYSIRCGVVAFQGARSLYQTQTVSLGGGIQLKEDEVSVDFGEIDRNGQVGEKATLPHGISTTIIGVNQNLRLILLEKHVEEKSDTELMFEPLRVFVGCEVPKPMFSDILAPAPPTFHSLNEKQKVVAHPLALKTAMDVAGPPGTGKSFTITELVRSILECTTADVIVLSERNGAIDAIAEKFADACLERSKSMVRGVRDVAMWTDLMAFGSSGVGPSTKLFTLEEKLKYHPELVELRRIEKETELLHGALGKRMRKAIISKIDELNSVCSSHAVFARIRHIESNTEPELERPCLIVATVRACDQALAHVLRMGARNLYEEEVDELVLDHRAILGGLVAVRTKEEKKVQQWTAIKETVVGQLRTLHSLIIQLKEDQLFSLAKAEEAQSRWRKVQESLRLQEAHLNTELVMKARVNMCTIGSSHRLPVALLDGEDDDSVGGLVAALGGASLDGEKDTVVIIDEAGCIPSYEFLGLSRLGRNIIGLVCVGDKNQLPPYDGTQFCGGPRSGRSWGRRSSFGDSRAESRAHQPPTPSLLDVSGLSSEDDAKIKLTTQYRVPRDIAAILNDRIYDGDYNTADECSAPESGFRFVHVPEYRGIDEKKYVNEGEVAYCVEFVRRFKREGKNSVMILTPYKKQQREIQFELKRRHLVTKDDEIPVLTIDQCQGQEADYVVLSLVQKPTRFLNKNRFNVALSRVRKRVYMLADKAKFREASANSNWECSLMAKDLLQLSASDDNEPGYEGLY